MIDPLFQVHRLNPSGMKKAVQLAEAFNQLLTNLELPPGRESALVRTHLELASFYSKKAMASQPENQESS
jgi:hypothetical protein